MLALQDCPLPGRTIRPANYTLRLLLIHSVTLDMPYFFKDFPSERSLSSAAVAASIFLKDCPECAAAIPAEALRCHCGYRFDSGRAETTVDGLELIAQEERLYCDYLAARVQQAAKELEHARAVAQAFPGDKVKSAELLLAEQRYNAARAELEAQKLRAQAVAARVKSARQSASRKRAVRSPVTGLPSRTEGVQKTEKAAPPHRVAAAKEPNKPAVANSAAAAAVPPMASASLPAAKPVRKTDPTAPRSNPLDTAAAPRGGGAANAAHPLPSPQTPPARRQKTTAAKHDTELPARAAAAVRPEAAGPSQLESAARASPDAQQPAPSPAAIQNRATASLMPTAGSPIPSSMFRTRQRARAALVVLQQKPTKDCPHCTATVPLEAKRCRCGFEFADGENLIPPLVLSAEERHAILQALNDFDRKR